MGRGDGARVSAVQYGRESGGMNDAWGKRLRPLCGTHRTVFHPAPGLRLRRSATQSSRVLLDARTGTDALPSREWSAGRAGPKPVSSIIDEAAPKESVDHWPLAIIIPKTLGDILVFR